MISTRFCTAAFSHLNDCWVITAPVGQQVHAYTTHFSVEVGLNYCPDYVNVYCGQSGT